MCPAVIVVFAFEGVSVIAEEAQPALHGLYLLFAKGRRPNPSAIREFASHQRTVSLSYDPCERARLQLVSADGEAMPMQVENRSSTTESSWLELLHNGLTFDLRGLAPGNACEIPAIEHRFDFPNNLLPQDMSALQIVPGEHLIGGKASMPVVKGMVALARDLTHHFEDIVGIAWAPSASAIGRRFFESISTAWLDGGAFPALGMTSFFQTEDGALQSLGLSFWVGQEIRIEKPISNDKVAATRLGIRIINHIILSGSLMQVERIVGPDRVPLIMKPSRNQKFIIVCPE